MRAMSFELVGQRLRYEHRSHSSVAVRHGSDGLIVDDVTEPAGGMAGKQEATMKFVLVIYQGSTPLPGSDRWQAMSEAEQKAVYADYMTLNNTDGVAPGLPLG